MAAPEPPAVGARRRAVAPRALAHLPGDHAFPPMGRGLPCMSYFFPDCGLRAGILVFDLKDPSLLPAISEPLFAVGAEVEAVPCMTLEDLKAGLDRVGRK